MAQARRRTSVVVPQRWFTYAVAGSQHPMEDAVRVASNERVFAVADGVTQARYPDGAASESGAGHVARMFVDRMVEIAQSRVDVCSDVVLNDAFRTVNDEIAEFNRRRVAAGEELVGTVGALAYLCDQGHVHYGVVGDCRVRICNSRFEPFLTTLDPLEPLRALLQGLEFPSPERRREFVTAFARNQPHARAANGARVGYGVFNGEPGVEGFFNTDHVKRPAGGYLVLHSDGCEGLFPSDSPERVVKTLARTSGQADFERAVSLARGAASEPEHRDDAAVVFVAL